MNINKPKTDLVNKKELDFILSTRNVLSLTEITEDFYLVIYEKQISKDVCLSHGLDYSKVLKQTFKSKLNKDIEYLDNFNDVSISTAAMILSYSRIFMSKIKLDILKRGGNIYYTDTDSIVTDIELAENLVGSGLGQFKLEFEIKEGYFISNKTYCLLLKKPIENKKTGELEYLVIKSKGVLNSSLSIGDFMDMYYLDKNIKAVKSNTITDYSHGSVTLGFKEATLKYDAFTKREKIYNHDGL
jgi:hypothetical protein